MQACHSCTLARLSVQYHYSNTVVIIAYLPHAGYVFSSVQSLAHHDLCSGSPPHVEAVYRVAAAAGLGCDAAAPMPRTTTDLAREEFFSCIAIVFVDI